MIWIALLALVHLVAAGVVTSRFWKPTRLSDYPATVLLTALSTFYGLPIIVGYTTSFMNTWVVVAAALVTVGLSGMAWGRKAAGDVNLRMLARSGGRLRLGEWIGWAIVAVILGGTLIVGSMFPIRIWDAAAYHSITPMAWAQSHRFGLHSFGDPTLFPYLAAGEVYPNVKAVLPFLVLEWTGSVDGTALAQWPWFAAIPVLMLAIFRRAGLPRWTVPMGALFVMLAPEVLLQSVEAYADVVFLAAVLFVTWCCLLTWDTGPTLRAMLLASLAFAQLAGSKPTGLPVCAAMGAIYLVVCFIAARSVRERALPGALARTGAALAIVLVACALIAGPWFLHGLRKLGNPVYPVQVAIGETVIFPGAYPPSFNTEFAERYAKASGLKAWWQVMMDAWRPPLLASWSGGMGLHSAALALPAFLLLLLLGVRGPWWRERLLLVVLCGVLILSCPTLTLGRFILFKLAFAAIGFGWLLGYTTALPRRALVGFASVCMAFDLYSTIPSVLYRARPAELVAYHLLSGDRRSMRDDAFPDEFSAMDFWREQVAKPGTVLALPGEWAPWNAFAQHSGANYIRLADPKAGEATARWLEDLRKSGATHVFTPRNSENYRVAKTDPAHFRLLIERVDSASESGRLFLEPKTHAALFEFVP